MFRRAVHWMLRLLVAFLCTSLLIFAALEAMPEDPVSLRVKNPDPARVAEVRADLGLDDPWVTRYIRYTTRFLSGDWGDSLVTNRPVAERLAHALPATIELGLVALSLGVFLGIGLALSSYWLDWPALKRLSSALGMLGLTVPIYWIGLLLIVAVAVKLQWLPVGGRYDFAYPPPSGTGFHLLDSFLAADPAAFGRALKHLALPAITLALYPAALVAGVLHGRLEDSRVQTLVRALRAKGLSPARIWWKHILRLMSAPVLTLIGTNFGTLLGGAVLTETVFSWPGMGRLLVEGVLNRDFFIISNGLLLVVLLALVCVALFDLLATLAQPALRRSAATHE